MMPELFRIPFLNIPIVSFGLMMVIGFLCAMQLAKFLAKRSGIDPELFVNAALLALVSGVIGARLSHVIENIGQYTSPERGFWANLFDAVNIRSGGLTYYGGFLLAFPTLVIYAIKKKIPVRLGMDIIAPCLMIGLGFGRIGCFLNGCCYGAKCELPWAVTFPYESIPYQDQFHRGEVSPPGELVHEIDGKAMLVPRRVAMASPTQRELVPSQRSLPLHPAQLYSSLTAFLIAALTTAFFTLPHAAGRGFALMMMVEGLTRYLLELLRAEPSVLNVGHYHLSLSMVLGIALMFVGGAMWFTFGRLSREKPGFPVLAPA